MFFAIDRLPIDADDAEYVLVSEEGELLANAGSWINVLYWIQEHGHGGTVSCDLGRLTVIWCSCCDGDEPDDLHAAACRVLGVGPPLSA